MVDRQFEPPAGWKVSSDATARLVQAADWSATSLGPRDAWSPSLKLAVDIILASAFPMALRWGPDFVLIYNDAYRPILGDKHPWALGKPAREAWAEVWSQIEPAHIALLQGKTPSIFAEDMLLRIQRHGSDWDDARFTLGYSPVDDPTAPTGIGGVLVTAVETTDRVAAEDALRASEEALRESRGFMADILRSAGEAFYAVDRDGSTTLCNQAFLRVLGFQAEEEVIGHKLHDVIHHTHPDGSIYEKSDCPIYICAATGEPAHVEHEYFYRLNGERFPVEYWVSPVFRDGVRQGAICTFVDITERRAAEAELAQREAEFRTFSQAVPNHVWASPPNGQLNWFNDRVYEYSGASPGALDGTGWVDLVHPDDVAAAAARWGAALASGEVYQTEFRLRRADGVYRWHLARALPIRGPAGEIVRWIGTNTDIQDQKTTAEALVALNESLAQRVAEEAAERDRLWQTSQDLLVVVDKNGIFKAANPAWASVLGWRPDEVVGKHHQAFVHPDDQAASEAALDRAQNGPLRAVENRHMHKDGGFRWISWIARRRGTWSMLRDATSPPRKRPPRAWRRRRRPCDRARRWRRSASSPAASPTTSTTCWRWLSARWICSAAGSPAATPAPSDISMPPMTRAARGVADPEAAGLFPAAAAAAGGNRRQQIGLRHVGSSEAFHRRGHPPSRPCWPVVSGAPTPIPISWRTSSST
jgi:PAS domain S-box-containing protein